MITTQSIKVNAANPEIPLQTFRAYRGSPSSVRVIDVPRKLGEWEITGVSVSVQYPNGRVFSRPCVRSGSCWVVTLGGTDVTGVTEGGYSIEASGKDETGADVSGYVLGVGDVEIMALDTSAHPDVAGWVVRLLDEEPMNPRRGDMLTIDGVPQIYDGETWISLKSGVVESTDYPGNASRADTAQTADYADTASFAMATDYASYADYATSTETANTSGLADRADNDGDGNNIVQTYARANELQVRLTLVEAAEGALKVAKDDVIQTFAQVKAYAETRNAVIVHGRGTYRPTYVSAAEMMWDCTGTVAGKVQTGMIHLFAAGEVVQLVPAKELALKEDVETPSDAKITIKQGGVEKGSFTLNQAGPETIELDAGGGGGGACLLTFTAIYASSQSVQWVKNGKTYKLTSGAGPCVEIYIDGREYNEYHDTARKSITLACGPELTIDYKGYKSDSMVIVDGELQMVSPTKISTAGHSHIYVELAECLAWDTLITMADGSARRVCDIRHGDKVLSIDPETLQLVPDVVVACDGGEVKTYNVADVWTFDDGTEITTVHPHEFYNVRTGRMEYIADFEIGDCVRKLDGTTTALVRHEQRSGSIRHNTLFTRYRNNYFAAGILTGNRYSARWGRTKGGAA